MFDETITSYKLLFPLNGQFSISSGNELRSNIAEHKVPNEPGCYLIYFNAVDTSQLIYIGKAGTIKNDGSFKDQGLAKRLCAKQDGKQRSQFFQELIEQYQVQSLYFQWFVTFDGEVRTLPAKAEADLIQAYYDEFGYLPLLNAGV